MKLKKTWMGICVYVIYFVGIIFAIGVCSFVSGLFLYYGHVVATGLMTLASLLFAFIVSFIGCNIGKKLRNNTALFSDENKAAWPDFVLPIITVIACIFMYPGYMSMTSPHGKMELVDAARVTKDGANAISATLLEKLYILKLNVLMSFLGNEVRTAIVFQAILGALLIILVYASLRVTIGRIGAFTAAICMVSVPVFGYSISIISETNLYAVIHTFTVLMIVLLIRGVSGANANKSYFYLLDCLVGALLGFSVFLDFGAISAIALMVAIFIYDREQVRLTRKIVHTVIICIGAISGFYGAVTYQYGADKFVDGAYEWFFKFFGVNNSAWIETMSRSYENTVLAVMILSATAISVFGYWLSGRNERILSWLLYVVVSTVLSVVLGATKLNSEIMLFVNAAILVACGASCFAYSSDDMEKNVVSEEETESIPESSQEQKEEMESVSEPANEQHSDIDQNEPVEQQDEYSAAEEKSEDENSAEDQIEENETVEKIPEENDSTENQIEEIETVEKIPEENDSAEEQIEEIEIVEEQKIEVEDTKTEEIKTEEKAEQEEKVRFVPEGMVLPVGEEDEENLEPHFNLHRPSMQDIGMLSLNRGKEEKEDIVKAAPKDDFDLPAKPGDDFDI